MKSSKESSKELQRFVTEYQEAKDHFLYYTKPGLDKFYKMFVSYSGDRAKQLQKLPTGEIWQSNVFMPYTFAYVKQYLQKTVGVAPDFRIEGKNGEALKEALLVIWKYRMSPEQIDYFLQCFINGYTIGKDFLFKKLLKKVEKDLEEEEEEATGVIDGIKKAVKKRLKKTKKVEAKVYWPDFCAVDCYDFFRHPRMKKLSDPLPVFQRYVGSLEEMKAMYRDVDKEVWNEFTDKNGEAKATMGDVQDYAYVRREVLLEAEKSLREPTESSTPQGTGSAESAQNQPKTSEVLFEWVERWMDDRLTVFVPGSGTNGAILLKDVEDIHDYEEKPFKKVSFFPRPFEFEGMGIPSLLIHMQELINAETNKIQDAVTIRVNGMIAATPTALPGYDQRNAMVIKPMGVLWTNDVSSVREINFGDINASNFVMLDRIKDMMRIVSGIDDYSVQSGKKGETATVASFMREATIEGIRLFLFLLRDAYIGHFSHFISMMKQYWTRRDVVPKEVLAAIDDFADLDFPVMDESWIDEEGKHKLWPDDCEEIHLEQTSTLASSAELRKTKDLELWKEIKDMPDEIADPETGDVYSIKKFKMIMRIMEDYGWDEDQMIVKKEAVPVPLEGVNIPGAPPMATPPNTPPALMGGEVEAPPLVGNEFGGDLASAF